MYKQIHTTVVNTLMEIHVSVKGIDTAFIHHMAEVVATNSTEDGKRMPDEIYLY